MNKRIKNAVICGLVALVTFVNSVSMMKSQKQAATTTYNQDKVKSNIYAQAKVVWDIEADITVSEKSDKTVSYKKNTWYQGMPYTQLADYSLKDFASCCCMHNVQRSKVTETNLLSRSYLVQIDLRKFDGCKNLRIGNDCSTAVAVAWRSCNNSLRIEDIDTSTFLSCAKSGSYSTYHLKTVGGYSIGSNTDTKSFLSKNENKSIIKNCYAKLKIGDAVFYRSGGKGHAMMVVATGSNCVYVIEQCGLSDKRTVQRTSWEVEKKYTYDDLIKSGYLPIYSTDVRKS